ncbi:MAG: cytochrome c [Pseudohongiellaceae bacterium]
MLWTRPVAVSLALVSLLAAGCDRSEQTGDPGESHDGTGRWYSEVQVESGRLLFREHCAVCHGDRAQGLAEDWQQRLPDGNFPAPPLDGSAHAWHHRVLMQVIDQGGVPMGGSMPAFGQVLDNAEKRAVIAWFQSHWSDEIYQQWLAMGGVD